MSPDHGFPALAGGTGDDRIAFGSRNGGALVDLMDIDPSLFNWEDICTGLARIPRFAGQTDTPVTWSVADHLLGIAARFVQNRTPSRKNVRFQRRAQTFVRASKRLPQPIQELFFS